VERKNMGIAGLNKEGFSSEIILRKKGQSDD